MITLLVRYPKSHHRHQVQPDWHPWGDMTFDLFKPGHEAQLTLTRHLAELRGCETRIAQVGTNFKADGGE